MKKYVYEKGIIYISKPTKQQVKNIKNSTLVFLKQVLKEKKQNGNNDKTRDIKEE